MVCFSGYPEDPRPRRAIAALVGVGMSIDFVCLGDGKLRRAGMPKWAEYQPASDRTSAGRRAVIRLSIFGVHSGVRGNTGVRSLRRRYDLMYMNNMPDVLVASALLPKLLGAKVILDQHDPMPELMTTIFGS